MACLAYLYRLYVSASDGILKVLSAYRNWLVRHHRDRCNIEDSSVGFKSWCAVNEFPAKYTL